MSAAILQYVASFDSTNILGDLVSKQVQAGFATQYLEQVAVWEEELRLIRRICSDLLSLEPRSKSWALVLEFRIPRRNKCPDLVVLADDVIFVIEFKFGAISFDSAAKWQVEDYALDLRDFHSGSEGRQIVPILVATNAESQPAVQPGEALISSVWPVLLAIPSTLARTIVEVFRTAHSDSVQPIEPYFWCDAAYRPSLSIIEAAQQLFSAHDVREISHSLADNLSVTTQALIEAIDRSRSEQLRTICFVTGVPGAGKTLTGLNSVHNPHLAERNERPSVFLSGNGPLVKVVREAIVRDVAGKRGWSRQQATREVGTFVQNVHSFIEEYSSRKTTEAPFEHVIVFDEAQRAWDAAQVFKKREIRESESQQILNIMARCEGWSTIIALVGGGQEIHTGEGGLEEWGRALESSPHPWRVLASSAALHGGDGMAGHRLFERRTPPGCLVQEVSSLHLSVSVRSYRAHALNRWVEYVLAGDSHAAHSLASSIVHFPVVLTRDLSQARAWLRDHARSDRRCGLVASSGAARLRADGIEVSAGFRREYKYTDWFLSPPDDVRSSSQLEVAATEFECQGLELDWVGVCWAGDLCVDPALSGWTYRNFKGSRWQNVKNSVTRRYLLNKYRVLLTRSREGMVIWVPNGDERDATRDPQLYDSTATFLLSAGARAIETPR